ncbi:MULTISPECIES: hypothetical protein [unclassified Endozoicomonas]|uniref:hypothetical protein n=1 Tax=unclassified Endozoicomonas TaxID=2644528 RepID=UPI003BB0FA6A
MAAVLSIGLATYGLHAAENPTGPTADSSTGKFDIILRNDVLIKLFGLEDVTFNTVSATTGDLTGFTPSCVDSNVEKYEVSLTSSNSFALSPGSGAAIGNIPYTLTYSQKRGAADQVWGEGHLASGVAAGEFARDGIIGGDTCDAALDSKITVDIKEADYKGKSVGVYSDTVTVTVSSI